MSQKLSNMKLEELRRECESKDISSDGRRKDLERLINHEKKMEREGTERKWIPSSTFEDTCDAILVTKVDFKDDDELDMTEGARQALGEILAKEDLIIAHDVEPITVGNQQGLNLARRPNKIEELENKVSSLTGQVSSLTSQEAFSASEIVFLKQQVQDLTISVEGYTLLRHRFISSFKRYKVGGMTPNDWKLIGEGNQAAYGGDAIADARLYQGTEGRRDFSVYEMLYGLPPQIVRDFSK